MERAPLRAVTGTARSARAAPPSAGSKRDRRIRCPCRTTTWCSPCPHPSAPSPTPTRRSGWTTVRCRRRDAAHDRRRSEALGCSDRHHAGAAYLEFRPTTIHTCTASYQAAALRRMPADGCRASRGSSSRCGFCRDCSGVASSKNSRTLHRDGQLKFFGEHVDLADAEAFADWLMPLRQCEWVVYAKRPFAGPEAVLADLSRYTHRVAISNSRLVASDDWRRHVPLEGLPRTRTHSLQNHDRDQQRSSCAASCCMCCPRVSIASATTDCSPTPTASATSLPFVSCCISRCPMPPVGTDDGNADHASPRPTFVCRHCGAPMLVIETFARAQHIRGPPASARSP